MLLFLLSILVLKNAAPALLQCFSCLIFHALLTKRTLLLWQLSQMHPSTVQLLVWKPNWPLPLTLTPISQPSFLTAGSLALTMAEAKGLPLTLAPLTLISLTLVLRQQKREDMYFLSLSRTFLISLSWYFLARLLVYSAFWEVWGCHYRWHP